MKKNFFYQKDQGQSFLELALIVPILLIIIAGTVDLSRLYLSYTALRDAAMEGANYGSLAPTETTHIEERVRAYSKHPLDLSDTSSVHVFISTDTNPCAGKQVTVKVTHDFVIATPLIGSFIGQSFPVSATVSNTILTPKCP